MKKPEDKTKEQLLNEIHELKAKIAKLEEYKTSDLTEIKTAEKKLIEEQNKAQQYLDIADVMLVSIDIEGLVQLINPKGCEILGYSKEEIMGQNWFDLVLPETQKERVKEVAKKVLAGEIEAVKYYENNIITKLGEERILAFHNSVLHDKNGKIVGTLSSGEDITKQRKIQESLAETQSFNETLLNTSPDIIYVYDLVESKNIYSNDGVTKILAYTVDEIKEMGDELISTLMHKDDFKTYLDEIIPRYQQAKDGEIIEHEYRMKAKNGEWRWLLSKESIFQRKADATPKQIFGIISDVTERKQTELKLMNEKERIRTILDMIGDPIFVKDNDHRMTLANQAFYEMFGMDEKSVIGSTLVEAVPEKEMEHFLSVDRAVLDTGIPDLREEELTIGDLTKTIITRKIRFIDESGEKFLVGSIYDITERKQAEVKLINEKEYSEELVNALPGVFYQISTQGKFVNWNKNFEIVSGYSHKEMGQISPIDLFEGVDKKRIAESIEQVFSQGSVLVEARLTSKEGIKVPYFFTGKRILINELPVLVGMGIDISELKEAENELKMHREQLEELVKERTKDLETKNKELDNAMKVFVGREMKIRDLEKQIQAFRGKQH